MTRFAAAAAQLAPLAARGLGWRPGEFWAATPAELALALGPADGPPDPPGRAEIARLIARDRARGDGTLAPPAPQTHQPDAPSEGNAHARYR